MDKDTPRNGGQMRRLSSLLSRQTSSRQAAADRRPGADRDSRPPSPRPKRCLNEGGHKLDR